ncbi:MAG TPA: hypothetical protein VHL09_06510, partial [Dehalococcoidia bacterium]|nr:hypothetical protein [Dehalococcoidia bacterium]
MDLGLWTFDPRWLGLALVIAVYLGFASAYAQAIPAWQSPDEPAHFNYLAEIGETGGLPVLAPGDYDGPYLETLKARGFPPELPVDGIRYEGHQPPLYYLAGSLIYELSGPAPDRQKLLPVRHFSIALGALALVVTFLIARLLVPGWIALG